MLQTLDFTIRISRTPTFFYFNIYNDTNRNIKRSVYCHYGLYSLTFRALALRQRETGFSLTKFLSDERANARNVRLYYSYWQYTDLFIFRFLSLLCLCSTLCLYNNSLGVLTKCVEIL